MDRLRSKTTSPFLHGGYRHLHRLEETNTAEEPKRVAPCWNAGTQARMEFPQWMVGTDIDGRLPVTLEMDPKSKAEGFWMVLGFTGGPCRLSILFYPQAAAWLLGFFTLKGEEVSESRVYMRGREGAGAEASGRLVEMLSWVKWIEDD